MNVLVLPIAAVHAILIFAFDVPLFLLSPDAKDMNTPFHIIRIIKGCATLVADLQNSHRSHPDSVLGEYSFIKLGSICKQGGHPHPLTFVQGVHYYPECFRCGKHCLDLALECTIGCSCTVHWECIKPKLINRTVSVMAVTNIRLKLLIEPKLYAEAGKDFFEIFSSSAFHYLHCPQGTENLGVYCMYSTAAKTLFQSLWFLSSDHNLV
ncbi:hypothetical protein PTKIN_Ptkin16aG0492400 [Pterospermum kingtungense]